MRGAQLDGLQILPVADAKADSLLELAVLDEELHATRKNLDKINGRAGEGGGQDIRCAKTTQCSMLLGLYFIAIWVCTELIVC